MPFDKELHPSCDTEGPFGIPMPDALAKSVQALLDAHPGAEKGGVFKLASADTSVEGERADISKITTEAVDRDREVVIAKGVNLKPYQSNPVVLLSHKWDSLPIGKAEWIKDFSGTTAGLVAKTRYAKRPSEWKGDWMPDAVFGLVKQGMLPGKSIGFASLEASNPTKAEIMARPELKDVARVHRKTVLLEYSVVAIPSNADALMEHVGKSCPSLAGLLDIVLPEQPTPADDVIARLEKYATSLPNPDELCETIANVKTLLIERKTLEDTVAAHSEAIRQLRKELIGKASERPQTKPMTPNELFREIGRLLPKSA